MQSGSSQSGSLQSSSSRRIVSKSSSDFTGMLSSGWVDGSDSKANKNSTSSICSTSYGSANKVSPDSEVASSTRGSTHDNSFLSKYLTDPTTIIPTGPKKPRPLARLLTSSDSLRLMEEKERKKQEENEEERRKKEREEKKNRKERQQSE